MVQSFNLEQPWTRQPFDTDLAWFLFQEYLTLPIPRRLSDLTRRPGGCPISWAQLETLAWEDGWKDRAAAWDRHLDALRLQTVEQVVKEDAAQRAARQGRVGKKLQTLAELELDKLIALASRKDGMPGVIQARDVIRAAGIGVRIERLALGDSTEKIETGPNLADFSVEELERLRELQEKAGKPAG